MARSHPGLEDFLGFMSTPEWRSAMLSAALAFGLLHAVTLLTPSLDLDASAADLDVPQLLHTIAVVLRFAVPFGFLTGALNRFSEQRRAASGTGAPARD